MKQYTYTIVHVGPPKASGRATVRVEKAKAWTPHGAIAKFKGRRMTVEELAPAK